MILIAKYFKEYGNRGFVFVGGGAFALALITGNNDLMSFSVVLILFSFLLFRYG